MRLTLSWSQTTQRFPDYSSFTDTQRVGDTGDRFVTFLNHWCQFLSLLMFFTVSYFVFLLLRAFMTHIPIYISLSPQINVLSETVWDKKGKIRIWGSPSSERQLNKYWILNDWGKTDTCSSSFMAMLVKLFPLGNPFLSWLSNSHPLADQKHSPNSHNHRCVEVGWLRKESS